MDLELPLTGLLGGTADQQVQIVTVLARAVLAHSDARRKAERRRLLWVLHTALDAASLHKDTLWAIYLALPYSAATHRLSIRIHRDLVAAHRTSSDEWMLTLFLTTHAMLLRGEGQGEAGIEYAHEAVELLRKLAQEDGYKSKWRKKDLERSLRILSDCLADAGRHDEAQRIRRERTILTRSTPPEADAGRLPELEVPGAGLVAGADPSLRHRRQLAPNPNGAGKAESKPTSRQWLRELVSRWLGH